MKPFTLEAIAAARLRNTKLAWPVRTLEYKGRTYSYFLVPSEVLPPDLPNAVMRMTPTKDALAQTDAPETITLFGVADSVPEAFQPFCIIHEIEEFVHIGLDHCGRCAQSAENEIALVMAAQMPMDDKRAYIEMRTKFFRDLIPFAGARPETFDEADVEEFRKSLIAFETAVMLSS